MIIPHPHSPYLGIDNSAQLATRQTMFSPERVVESDSREID